MVALAILLAACSEAPTSDERPGTFNATGTGCLTAPSSEGSTEPQARYRPFVVDGFLFVQDVPNGDTVPVFGPDGAGSASADGRYVALEIGGVTAYVRDTTTGDEIPVSVLPSGAPASKQPAPVTPSNHLASISADGRFVVFSHSDARIVPGDTNGKIDVFVRDLVEGTTERVSVATSGQQTDDDSWSGVSAISGDGRYVVFSSLATTLAPGDANGKRDVFVRDRRRGVTIRVSVAPSGEPGNGAGGGGEASISRNGRYVAFVSDEASLVPDDTNGRVDVFVHDLVGGGTVRASLDATGGELPGGAVLFGVVPLNADGSCVAFATDPVLAAGYGRLYLRDLVGGTTRLVPGESARWPEDFDLHPADKGSVFPDGGSVLLVRDGGSSVSALDLRSATVVPLVPTGQRFWAVSSECSPPLDALYVAPLGTWRFCHPSAWWMTVAQERPDVAQSALDSTLDRDADDGIDIAMHVSVEKEERPFSGDSACVKGEYIVKILDCGVVDIAGHRWGFQHGIDFRGWHSLWYYTDVGRAGLMGTGTTPAKGDFASRVELIRSIFESSRVG